MDRNIADFYCWCAERALASVGVADGANSAAWNAIRAKRGWLSGVVSREELNSAAATARKAAWDTPRDSAQNHGRRAAVQAAANAATFDGSNLDAWNAPQAAAEAVAYGIMNATQDYVDWHAEFEKERAVQAAELRRRLSR